MQTLIRQPLEEQSDLVLHCLHMSFLSETLMFEILGHLLYKRKLILIIPSVVQNGEKIGISGAFLPEKTCYNKLKHCNRSSMS